MIPMTVSDIATAMGIPPEAATRGGLGSAGSADAADTLVTSVEFDSRKITDGSLFVALTGESVDGHDFASAAEKAGAAAVLGSRPVDVTIPAFIVSGGDTGVLDALAALARQVAGRLIADGLTVVGVTGSAGKTSTKDLIAAVLRRAGTVIAPPESFNNEIGHPYTVLRADTSTKYLVLELSARGIGHIASLATIAPPSIGVVLNVGSAHIGEFGSADAIAVAKGELVEALPSAANGGVAVLNADDPRVAAMAARTSAAIVTTGLGEGATVSAHDVVVDGAARASFVLDTPKGSAAVLLRLVGVHQVPNALAAAAVGLTVGMDVSDIAEALSGAEAASKWRMQVSELPGGVTLINDAYNSNPESARSALSALSTIAADRRAWAVLGEMAELGPAAPDAHLELGRRTAEFGVSEVLAVGEAARGIHDGAITADGATRHGAVDRTWNTRSRWVPDAAAALDVLDSEVADGDVVLVKASRSVNLQRLALAFAERRSVDPQAAR
jgi:UDP-N-acetylmuramoyl-tripeptide--D-alanyl-D-alanine ligase